MKGICILNAECCGYGGHHFSYASGMATATGHAGLKFHCLVNRTCDPDVVALLHAKPTLEMPGNVTLAGKKIPGIGRVVIPWKSARGLKNIPDEVRSPEWGVFVENVARLVPQAFLRFLRSVPPARSPVYYIMLRYTCYQPSTGTWKDDAEEYRSFFKKLDALPAGYRIKLVTDSDLLATQYEQLTARKVHVIPTINHVLEYASDAQRDNPSQRICVASPGIAGRMKGSDVLAKAVLKLAQENELSRFHFLFQCYRGNGNDKVVDEIIRDLEPLEGEGVSLIRESLDAAGYREILNRADLVVTPYQVDRYQATSGPFAEALTLGIPVVATRGSWMAHELGKYDAGLVFNEGNVDDLAATLLCAADQYDGLKAKAETAGKRWREFHNPDSYLEQLLKIAG